MGDERLDDREDVLDPMVELLVEDALAQFGLARSSARSSLWRSTTRRGRRESPPRSRAPRPSRARLAAHRLLPDREALARRQPVARAGRSHRSFPGCRPSSGSARLPCGRKEIVTRPLRQRNGEHARGGGGISSAPGRVRRAAMGRADAALGDRSAKRVELGKGGLGGVAPSASSGRPAKGRSSAGT